MGSRYERAAVPLDAATEFLISGYQAAARVARFVEVAQQSLSRWRGFKGVKTIDSFAMRDRWDYPDVIACRWGCGPSIRLPHFS